MSSVSSVIQLVCWFWVVRRGERFWCAAPVALATIGPALQCTAAQRRPRRGGCGGRDARKWAEAMLLAEEEEEAAATCCQTQMASVIAALQSAVLLALVLARSLTCAERPSRWLLLVLCQDSRRELRRAEAAAACMQEAGCEGDLRAESDAASDGATARGRSAGGAGRRTPPGRRGADFGQQRNAHCQRSVGESKRKRALHADSTRCCWLLQRGYCQPEKREESTRKHAECHRQRGRDQERREAFQQVELVSHCPIRLSERINEY